mmetsp:Transcript_19291/g.31576  ORF Transcript_19291/g.31576 Transcript_19291/m.31576 type:complete len:215 (+) Transcript_19291:32-676(+)
MALLGFSSSTSVRLPSSRVPNLELRGTSCFYRNADCSARYQAKTLNSRSQTCQRGFVPLSSFLGVQLRSSQNLLLPVVTPFFVCSEKKALPSGLLLAASCIFAIAVVGKPELGQAAGFPMAFFWQKKSTVELPAISPDMVTTRNDLPGFKVVKNLGIILAEDSTSYRTVTKETIVDLRQKAASMNANAVLGLNCAGYNGGGGQCWGSAVVVEPE